MDRNTGTEETHDAAKATQLQQSFSLLNLFLLLVCGLPLSAATDYLLGGFNLSFVRFFLGAVLIALHWKLVKNWNRLLISNAIIAILIPVLFFGAAAAFSYTGPIERPYMGKH